MRRRTAKPAPESPRAAWIAFADNIAVVMVFLSFFAAHWLAQAIAWANESRNAAWHLIFGLLGLPLVHLAGARTDDYFLPLSVPNSAVWAAVLTAVAARWRSRREGSRSGGDD